MGQQSNLACSSHLQHILCWSRAWLCVWTCSLLLGCETTAKVDNPVVGPPPPRYSPEKIRERQLALGMTADASGGGAIASVDIEPSVIRPVSGTVREFPDDLVVARVNEQPVFVSEMTRVFDVALGECPKFTAIEKRIQEEPQEAVRDRMWEEYQGMRKEFIQKHLPIVIERKLLAQASYRKMKKAEREGIQPQLDKMWDDYLNKLEERFKADSRAKLLLILDELGFDLVEMRKSNEERLHSSRYLQQMIGESPAPTRTDILEYYEQHQDKYAITGKVRWQQLEVLDLTHGGEQGAKRHMAKAVQELLDGADFTAVIKKYGDGLKAQQQDGKWDWTQVGGLRDKDLEKQLFELPVGEMSGVMRVERSFQIVQVLERIEPGVEEFEGLQKEIKGQIEQDRWADKTKSEIQRLKDIATITTVFDVASSNSDLPVANDMEMNTPDEFNPFEPAAIDPAGRATDGGGNEFAPGNVFK